MDNLKDLKQKYKDLGEEIERLEKEEPTTKPGDVWEHRGGGWFLVCYAGEGSEEITAVGESGSRVWRSGKVFSGYELFETLSSYGYKKTTRRLVLEEE